MFLFLFVGGGGGEQRHLQCSPVQCTVYMYLYDVYTHVRPQT